MFPHLLLDNAKVLCYLRGRIKLFRWFPADACGSSL
jgi:hypothetical protein